ncbi:uncharacterized protein J4E88_002843 [Alternaria novae-zelandiae]|uniref:uncharacterized protein n=1 Tax=Alternaria novae-zelandiae TaxID=430562 RepID=UPI0020C2C5F2|nr:uncharacterized protein J4E88_002843 [Alternaria novae-zelandiae]KAI4689491.1 hypothetical protein J4E88_002843 [Alternaria novae-zelandiae]
MSNRRKVCHPFGKRTSRRRGPPKSKYRSNEPKEVPIPPSRSLMVEVVDKSGGVSKEVLRQAQPKLDGLPDEILLIILLPLHNDKITLDAFALTARHFLGTVRTTKWINNPIALRSGPGADPKANPDRVLARLIYHLYNLSHGTTASIVQMYASGFKTISIDRHHNYINILPADIFTAPIIERMKKTIYYMPGLTMTTRNLWLRQVQDRYEPAVVALLLTFLSGLESIDLSGDLTCLWSDLASVTSFKLLSTLHLRQITNCELTTSCCNLMRLPSLKELAFFDMTITDQILRNICYPEKLSVTAIRLIRCYIAGWKTFRLLQLCKNLEVFEYTINMALYVKSFDSDDRWNAMLWGWLLSHKASLRRLILTGSGGSNTAGVFLGDLREFHHLRYLEVDQNLIQDAWHADYETLLNHFPKSLETLKMNECSSQVAIKLLEMAADAFWPELGTLKLTCLPCLKGLPAVRAKLDELRNVCEEKGIWVDVEESDN